MLDTRLLSTCNTKKAALRSGLFCYVLIVSGLLLLVVAVSSCSPERDMERTGESRSFVSLDSSATGIGFINYIENTKDYNIFNYRNFYNGGGVAAGDINNDGLEDLYFTSNLGDNRLYLNEGDLRFRDISQSAGITESESWSTGVVMVDIDADGLLDIYVCNAGLREGGGQENALYINQGNETFTEQAASYGLDDHGYTTHAAFFDFDQDGDLDVYLLNNSFIPVNTLNYSNNRSLRAEEWDVRDFLKGGGDKLMRNDGGIFTDISQDAGIYGSLIGFGLGVTIGDVNQDGWLDMYISNDFYERDYLYINQRDGTFSEELESRMGHISLSSMGADIGDVNNDGFMDIFVTDMLAADEKRLKNTTAFENINISQLKEERGFYHQYMHNTLQLNDANGQFTEAAHASGVSASDWSWGALMLDADNDKYLDLLVCNGIYHDVINQDFIDFFADELMQKMALSGKKSDIDSIINYMPSEPIPNKMFRNIAGARFEDVSEVWGFRPKTFSNGAAYADLDNDGDLDLAINNVNMPAIIYRNDVVDVDSSGYIGFELVGASNNLRAVGASVHVYTGDTRMTRINIPSRGFQSSSSDLLHFGTGTADLVDSVHIYWPTSELSVLYNLALDSIYHISFRETSHQKPHNAPPSAVLFTEVDNHPFSSHVEDDYNEFFYERNIFQKSSKEGPAAIYGDVTGDGVDDVVIAGAAGQATSIYAGHKGTYEKLSGTALDEYMTPYEDTALELADVNGDGSLDLLLGAGGNHHPPMTRPLVDRLLLSNSDGTLNYGRASLPKNGMNTSKIISVDIDSDGDLDLVHFSRNVPLNYALDPPHYIFKNLGQGKFRDVSTEHTDIFQAGMIVDACLSDVTGGSAKEIVTISDWGAPGVYVPTSRGYEKMNTSLSDLKSWWRSVAVADLDGDGYQDIVLGNLGHNLYLGTDDLPVKMWVNDFDKNGTVEKIMTRTVAGRDVPVFMKRDVVDQVVSLKKANLKHADFAEKSIQELFSEELIESSLVQEINHLGSIIAYGREDDDYDIVLLPFEAQLSSIEDLSILDIDGDGRRDILAVGNEFGFLPQFGRLDANQGLVLLQGEDRQWNILSRAHTGLDLRGMCRDILEINYEGKDALLFLMNDDVPQLYVRTDEKNL